MRSELQKVNGQTTMPMTFEDEQPAADAGLRQVLLAGKPTSQRRRRVHMTVTPTIARRWLDCANSNNRPLMETVYTGYACDMIDGRWLDNGDAIRFSREGVLLDGQHRLRACVEAGVSFDTDVIIGLDPASLSTIDTGAVRTAAHIVGFYGVQNATNACALATFLIIHRKHGISRYNNAACKPTKAEVVELARADGRIQVVAGRAVQWGKKLAPPRVLTFCYYLFSEQNETRAEEFFREFHSGTDLQPNNPVYVLRERLIANRTAKAKLPLLEILALFFKAWAAYRDSRPIKVLRWSQNANEPFPEI